MMPNDIWIIAPNYSTIACGNVMIGYMVQAEGLDLGEAENMDRTMTEDKT